ncbi:MAG: rod shape-determining protein MreC [Candidatus Marinimicrobia bacterium]|nr:rod shape-determining protein MreC [Candidatus Neomarinimicrobiota bacterium]
MRSFYYGISRNRHHITFFVTFVTSVLIYLSNTAPEIIYLRSKFISVFSILTEPISHIQHLMYVEEESALLRERNTQLVLQLETLLKADEENKRLKGLLDFKQKNPLQLIPGIITSTGMTTGIQTAVIDIGRVEGVNPNTPVLTDKGVIGKIILTSDSESIVQLMNDINYRLAVRVQPSGASGIMRYISGQICEIHEVPKNAQIDVGDRVVTSGFSDIYPPDLPVGKVTGVYEERGSFQKIITIKIYNDLNSLNHVFIIKDSING